jgi:hypothetical protein
MDIYKQAEEMDADYMDKNGNVYKIQEYNRAVKRGLPTEGIKVVSPDGEFLGFALRVN